MAGLIAYFGQHFDMVRCANRFENWTGSSPLSYRNVNTNLAFSYEGQGEPIRFIAEVQFHFRDFFPLGKLLHKTYEVCRAKSCWEIAGQQRFADTNGERRESKESIRSLHLE